MSNSDIGYPLVTIESTGNKDEFTVSQSRFFANGNKGNILSALPIIEISQEILKHGGLQ
jgi:aminopeptidase N